MNGNYNNQWNESHYHHSPNFQNQQRSYPTYPNQTNHPPTVPPYGNNNQLQPNHRPTAPSYNNQSQLNHPSVVPSYGNNNQPKPNHPPTTPSYNNQPQKYNNQPQQYNNQLQSNHTLTSPSYNNQPQQYNNQPHCNNHNQPHYQPYNHPPQGNMNYSQTYYTQQNIQQNMQHSNQKLNNKFNKQNRSQQKIDNKNNQQKEQQCICRCEPCERDFTSEIALVAHQKMHVQCDEVGCNYKASSKAVKLHHVQMHAEGKFRIVLKTPDEITKWREERKKRWPTVSNIDKKKRKCDENDVAGITVETKKFCYRGNEKQQTTKKTNTPNKNVHNTTDGLNNEQKRDHNNNINGTSTANSGSHSCNKDEAGGDQPSLNGTKAGGEQPSLNGLGLLQNYSDDETNEETNQKEILAKDKQLITQASETIENNDNKEEGEIESDDQDAKQVISNRNKKNSRNKNNNNNSRRNKKKNKRCHSDSWYKSFSSRNVISARNSTRKKCYAAVYSTCCQ